MKLSTPVINFILELNKKGKITNSGSGLLRMTYYTIVWYLKGKDIIVCDGTNEKNEKVWVLSDRGQRLAHHLKEINKLFKEDKHESEAVNLQH
ncbi:MAG: hypothetical protein ACE5KE_06175 [Methanosarcinales archaeon]